MVTYRADGKTRWEYFGQGLAGEKKARERDQELKANGIIGGYVRQPTHMTAPLFGTLANEYLGAKSLEMSKISIRNLMWKLKAVILPELGDIEAMRINPELLRDYIKRRLAAPVTALMGKFGHQRRVRVTGSDGRPRTISKTTINREISDIIAILNWSVAEGYIPRNPAAKFKKPGRDDEIILPPTVTEIRAIMDHAAPHLVRALNISFYTGLRPGAAELFGIRWQDINLESGQIFILSAHKGGPKFRVVPLHPELKEKLIEWQAEDLKKKYDYLIRWEGKPVASIKTAFIQAKKRAGITRRLRLYDFRHAFATAILKAGGDLKSTSEMLGHSRTDTTSRVYQHTDIEMHRENINRLPGLAQDKEG